MTPSSRKEEGRGAERQGGPKRVKGAGEEAKRQGAAPAGRQQEVEDDKGEGEGGLGGGAASDA